MDTSKLKKFAQHARRSLLEQVASKLTLVLADDSAARRQNFEAVKQLEQEIKTHSKEQVIEKVAYTWFNRFCALRFMDVNRYTRIGIVSPADGQSQPEILAEAKMGHLDEEMVPEKTRQKIAALFSGDMPSRDPQAEIYRMLLVAACNAYHRAMPYLFERIDHYTELLIPDDLLSENSILTLTLQAMTPEVCKDVEVIGWLYQFYISEKKDEVFEGLKKNKKVTPENIPAATQLFTPHWIVRYLVENSLGRLWMLNRPGSKLVEQMEYYIRPEKAETNFLRISNPEEIKICDPACGSGHMLVYAFDLLYAIYEEEGYESSEIPEKILTHNLFGIEIDERAGELAAFALTMKAREKHRRFLRKPVQPYICVLENIKFDKDELESYMDFAGRDLFTTPLRTTLQQFEEADNFGSLIRPEVTDIKGVLKILAAKDISGQLFLSKTHPKVLKALEQTDYLSQKYHVVVANPPYMGGKGMNGRLGAWIKENYPDVKSDLFSAFIARNTELALPKGQLGFMSPFVWMFISSYEKLRRLLIDEKTITSLVQLEYSGFDGATVPICTFTLENAHHPNFKGGYVRLSDFRGSDIQGPKTLEAIKNPDCGWFFRVSAADFKKIPGSPIAYWVSEQAREAFINKKSLNDIAEPRVGLDTGNNEKFIRTWQEVQFKNIGFSKKDIKDFWSSQSSYVPHTKGGDYRNWYGNLEHVLKFDPASYNQLENSGNHLPSRQYYFLEGASWTRISSSLFSIRYSPVGTVFNSACPTMFADHQNLIFALALLSSKVANYFIALISPTLNFQAGEVRKMPVSELFKFEISQNAESAIEISRQDWDNFETAWDFQIHPLLRYNTSFLSQAFTHWQQQAETAFHELKRLEEVNNRYWIEAYGLQDELTPEVPDDQITIRRADLARDIRSFLSYAVGCMFGRYSLDKPGLILANQGETAEDYYRQVPERTFPPDEDNVLPILDGDWFIDDISDRFRKFLRVTFGEDHYEENLKFIESAIAKDIRKYFLKDFYNDHVKRYKKRPIYWLFSSPKGSFNALIYMHRYRPDTVSVVLNDYLREFRVKLNARVENLRRVDVSADASQSEKTKAIKEIEKLNKTIEELDDYERDVMYPLAIKQVQIDLDDGVKVNYQKFGAALKKIPGLETTEE